MLHFLFAFSALLTAVDGSISVGEALSAAGRVNWETNKSHPRPSTEHVREVSRKLLEHSRLHVPDPF